MGKVAFDDFKYQPYRHLKYAFKISTLIGFDSETKISGRPFLFCDSDGGIYQPRELYDRLFARYPERVDFAVWNLRFDAGSVLYPLPLKLKTELWEKGEVEYEGIHISYIPHKHLGLRKGKVRLNFWDIMPFYQSGLDAASQKYLGEKKDDLPTKKFTDEYIKDNLPKIQKYCIKDAKLTASLGNLLLSKLASFKIYPKALYSTASVSFQHFLNTCEYMHVMRFWEKYRDLLRFASEAYYGGKFEVTARGRFYGYEYDVISAYGSELMKLKNLRFTNVKYHKGFLPRQDYGFLRVEIDNKNNVPIPSPIKSKGVNIYPAGKFKTTVTLQEYTYYRKHKIPIKVFEGWYLKFYKEHFPYKKEIQKLYKIKEDMKTDDPMLSSVAKTMVNSLYGKFIQVTEDFKGNLKCGIGWNPIYAAIITANLRIRMTEQQAKLKDHCLGVHTDSIITDKELPKSFCGKKMGDWELKQHGEALIITCGVFQLGTKNANRSHYLPKTHNWIDLLKDMGTRSKLMLTQTQVKSWTGQVARGKDGEINQFIEIEKELDLNSDHKRIWLNRTNAKKLLSGLEYSLPRPALEE